MDFSLLKLGPYRFYFYSHEPNEPPHIHVDRDRESAKFWLNSGELANNIGYSPKELRKLRKLVLEHQQLFLEAWYGWFGDSSR